LDTGGRVWRHVPRSNPGLLCDVQPGFPNLQIALSRINELKTPGFPLKKWRLVILKRFQSSLYGGPGFDRVEPA
jgi:hypothetical protein